MVKLYYPVFRLAKKSQIVKNINLLFFYQHFRLKSATASLCMFF